MRNPRLTLRFVVRTLTRLRHASKLGPNVLAYCLVKKYAAKASQLEHLARFLLETAERMKELNDERPPHQVTIQSFAVSKLRSPSTSGIHAWHIEWDTCVARHMADAVTGFLSGLGASAAVGQGQRQLG
jgi:hypothetical protein